MKYWKIGFLSLFIASFVIPALAGGKFYYGTDEGAAVQVSLPLGEERIRVQEVTDGDTIRLENGERVRYIGIDTPEERHRVGNDWVYDPEPFAVEATEENRRLVEGKKVRLEFDEQKRDRFGRLLAYVYAPIGLFGSAAYDGEVRLDSHEIFVNAHLLQQGLAKPLPIPPNMRYTRLFKRLAQKAKENHLGLWKK